MQVAQQPIFQLTGLERALFNAPGGATRKIDWKGTPTSYRLRTATQNIINDAYAAAKFVAPKPERPREYDHSITVPAFNDWVDRQIEKQLAAQCALREAAAAAAEAESTDEGSANGEVLR